MKGKGIIKLIKDYNLKNFDVFVSFTDGYNVFPNVVTIPIVGIIMTNNGVHLFGEEDSTNPLKGHELMKIILDNHLADKEITVNFKSNNSEAESANLIELGDIGYSDGVVHFEGEI